MRATHACACITEPTRKTRSLPKGLPDAEGDYLTDRLHGGVWLTDRILDASEGVGTGKDVLDLEIPEEIVALLRVDRGGQGLPGVLRASRDREPLLASAVRTTPSAVARGRVTARRTRWAMVVVAVLSVVVAAAVPGLGPRMLGAQVTVMTLEQTWPSGPFHVNVHAPWPDSSGCWKNSDPSDHVQWKSNPLSLVLGLPAGDGCRGEDLAVRLYQGERHHADDVGGRETIEQRDLGKVRRAAGEDVVSREGAGRACGAPVRR